YSMHAIVPDLVLGITRLARDLMLAGHRKLGAVEPRGSTSVSQALRQAAARYAPETLIETAEAAEAADLVRTGATALVCGSSNGARKTRATLDKHGITVPGRVSLAAVGCSSPDAACSGYFVDCGKISEGIVNLLKDAIPRPVTLWIPGTWVDRGTIAPTGSALPFEEPPPLQISGVVV
ncbi:MAG TPA: substrate-binding domain-containing protein, partial [Tepidisphaeraceae bacterium]|nr:substrate-binding domain-containing protein [Tepidisphaeraceae bacterium]